jgi:hypothetical protein
LNRDQEHAEAIKACEDGKALIIQLQNEPSGAEVFAQTASKTFSTIEEKFKSLKLNSKYSPLIKSLIQLASSQNLADQSIVNRIIDLIDELMADLASSRTDADTDEAQAVENYNAFMEAALASFDQLNIDLENQEAELDRTQNQITVNEQIITDQTIIRDDNQKLLDELIAWCKVQAEIYLEETTKR